VERTDVVVVGAGPAGLRVADLLQRRGVAVIVLEARDRVGGRLFSMPVEAGWVDLGATWFWPSEPDVVDLVAAEDLDAFDQYQVGDVLVQTAAGVQRIDAGHLGAPSKRLAGGMQSVAHALLRRLQSGTVRLAAPVRSIVEIDDAVEIVTDAAGVRADHVVIAVPPATAMHLIDIRGDLAPDVRALASATPVWMGAFAKIVAWYDRPFWRDMGRSGSAFSQIGPLREVHDLSGPEGSPAALFGFVPLEVGRSCPDVPAVLAQLVDLFGPDAGDPVGVEIADWRAEPFTSPPGADALYEYRTYGHPGFRQPAFGGRLHWAATETATDAPGHVQGALSAAARVASTITA
jgi:monoamine oxidase